MLGCFRLKPYIIEEQVEYLGVIILDRGLTWRGHVKKIEGQLSKVIYSMITLKRFLSLESLRIVYMSFFQSIFTYCISVYGGVGDTILMPILRLQRRAIKTILNLTRRYPSSELCDLLNVNSFEELYKRELTRLTPIFYSKIQMQEERKYNFRNVNQLTVPLPAVRLETTKKNVGYKVIENYNLNKQQTKTS